MKHLIIKCKNKYYICIFLKIYNLNIFKSTNFNIIKKIALHYFM